jgi:hypothetical protein
VFSFGAEWVIRAIDGEFDALCRFHRVHEHLRQAKCVSPEPPLRRSDGKEAPLAGHALERVSAAVFELES